MPTIRMDLRRYPGYLVDKAKQFPFAASQALNDTAFRLKRELEHQATGDLNFRKAPRPALGIAVSQKASKTDLHAIVDSSRGWMTHQVQDGTTTPKRGIRYKGKSYLLIPNPKVIRNRSKASGGQRRFKTGRGGKVFILKAKSQLIMMLRFGSDEGDITPLGILEPKAAYADDFDWDGRSDKVIEGYMLDRFEFRLGRAMASRR